MWQGYLGLRSFARRKPRHNANGTAGLPTHPGRREPDRGPVAGALPPSGYRHDASWNNEDAPDSTIVRAVSAGWPPATRQSLTESVATRHLHPSHHGVMSPEVPFVAGLVRDVSRLR